MSGSPNDVCFAILTAGALKLYRSFSKTTFALLLPAIVCLTWLSLSLALAGAPEVKASAAILVDAETGQVLWSRNADARRPMASTTKIMTALLALEHGQLEKVVTVPAGVDQIPESSFHLIPGEKMTLRDLLLATVVRSANDAAVVVGREVAGSDAAFVEMMNRRAAELGMRDTAFKNPNGLHDKGHYSTARDLAILARAAICLPLFNEMCATRSIVIERAASKDELVQNKARFLRDYAFADGIKSGYTRQAGACYVGSATRDGWRLVSVVMNSPNTSAETQALMEYGFKGFERVTLARAGDEGTTVGLKDGNPSRLPLLLDSDLTCCVPRGSGPARTKVEIGYIPVPLNRGDKVGEMVALVGDRPVARVGLIAAADVSERGARSRAFLAAMALFPFGYVALRRSQYGDANNG